MPVTVKRVTLWRSFLANIPGSLAKVLQPLARTGADLQVVMGYRIPGDASKAVVELAPVSGKRAEAAAQQAGLSASSIPTLLVVGDNRPGLGHAMSKAIADAGINMSFLVAQVIGKKYSAIIGFENEEDAKKATSLVKKATVSKKR